MMIVKPGEGLRVRDPHRPDRFVRAGESVDELDLDWHRLIASGDLVETTPEEVAADEAAAKAEADRIAAEAEAEAHPQAPAEPAANKLEA